MLSLRPQRGRTKADEYNVPKGCFRPFGGQRCAQRATNIMCQRAESSVLRSGALSDRDVPSGRSAHKQLPRRGAISYPPFLRSPLGTQDAPWFLSVPKDSEGPLAHYIRRLWSVPFGDGEKAKRPPKGRKASLVPSGQSKRDVIYSRRDSYVRKASLSLAVLSCAARRRFSV